MALRLVRRSLLVAVAAALSMSVLAGPALAGGSWFSPVEDRYEPGDDATLVGYTGGGSYGWIEDGPFFGFLVDSNENGEPILDGERRPLGEIELEDTGAGGYLRLRASITFTVPAELEPGTYWFDYCNADCTERLGDLIGGIVHVGVDPEFPVSREWPLNDPEVANLDDAAQLSGPGFNVTAGELKSTSVDSATGVTGTLVPEQPTTLPGIPRTAVGLSVVAALSALAVGTVWGRRYRVGAADAADAVDSEPVYN